jgi:hypothetical protein
MGSLLMDHWRVAYCVALMPLEVRSKGEHIAVEVCEYHAHGVALTLSLRPASQGQVFCPVGDVAPEWVGRG